MNVTPISPLAVVTLLMTGIGGLVVSVKTAVPVPLEFIAPIVTLLIPAIVGVPEITPVVVFTLSPAGRLVALNVAGFRLAFIV